ncbi:MAG: TetR/AcrR family transcriptional regulator [Gammaproteobacteria bacterium]|nr:TetR/AcrR family transcriptional regulator [Gammaproteobacteria bacterium]
MPRGRAARYGEQQDSILQHAAALFAARGFQGTSMLDLAHAAGVSKALLYHYYEDKYQLLVAIAEGHIDRLVALVAEEESLAAAGHRSSAHRLEHLVRRFVEEYASARAHHQVLVQDLKYLDEDDQARIRQKERQVVAAFAQAIAADWPELGARKLEKPLSMLLFGMINWLFTWFRDEGPLDYPALARLVAGFATGGLSRISAPSP